MNFNYLTQVIAEIDTKRKLALVVVDTDGLTSNADLPFFGNRHGGWGETAWFENGKPIAVWCNGDDMQVFRDATIALVAHCDE